LISPCQIDDVLLRRHFVQEIFCYRKPFVKETFCYGDILLRRRLVRRRFVRIHFVCAWVIQSSRGSGN
jgi:hypothetical protein